MRRVALSAIALAVVVFGVGLGAPSVSAYPPSGPSATVSPATVASGGSVTVTVTGCEAGEQVDFVLESATATATCVEGQATAQMQAPSSPGTYTGTATGRTSGVTASFSVTVAVTGDGGTGTPGGQLPSTGSDGVSNTVIAAGGLFLAGLAMMVVSQIRRRRPVAA